MFYIVEQIKGTPKVIEGLLFGSCTLYDYYVVGCKTIEENTSGYYNSKSSRWQACGRKNTPSSFIQQFNAVKKRDKFNLSSDLMFY